MYKCDFKNMNEHRVVGCMILLKTIIVKIIKIIFRSTLVLMWQNSPK
jgi:hypothetical protein